MVPAPGALTPGIRPAGCGSDPTRTASRRRLQRGIDGDQPVQSLDAEHAPDGRSGDHQPDLRPADGRPLAGPREGLYGRVIAGRGVGHVRDQDGGPAVDHGKQPVPELTHVRDVHIAGKGDDSLAPRPFHREGVITHGGSPSWSGRLGSPARAYPRLQPPSSSAAHLFSRTVSQLTGSILSSSQPPPSGRRCPASGVTARKRPGCNRGFPDRTRARPVTAGLGGPWSSCSCHFCPAGSGLGPVAGCPADPDAACWFQFRQMSRCSGIHRGMSRKPGMNGMNSSSRVATPVM